MPSPFVNAANAEIVFFVPGVETTEDKNGNLAPVEVEQKIIALLKPSKPSPKIQAGMDEFDEYLKGYLVDPVEMPDSISSFMAGRIIRKISASKKIEGIFRLLPLSQNPFVMAAGVEGVYQISGLFKAR